MLSERMQTVIMQTPVAGWGAVTAGTCTRHGSQTVDSQWTDSTW